MADEPTSPDHVSDEQQYQSSLLVFEQAEYLLNDEIGYATALRTQRRTLSGLLAIVIGLGIFRFDLFGSIEDQPLVPEWALWTIRILITIAIPLIIYGTWSLYSERPIIEADEIEPESPVLEDGKSSAALCVLDLERKYRKTLEQAPPLLTIRARTLILSVAYRRLSRANRRVRYRIQRGKKALFLGMIVVFSVFVLYTWTSGVAHGCDKGTETPAEAATGVDDRAVDG